VRPRRRRPAGWSPPRSSFGTGSTTDRARDPPSLPSCRRTRSPALTVAGLRSELQLGSDETSPGSAILATHHRPQLATHDLGATQAISLWVRGYSAVRSLVSWISAQGPSLRRTIDLDCAGLPRGRPRADPGHPAARALCMTSIRQTRPEPPPPPNPFHAPVESWLARPPPGPGYLRASAARATRATTDGMCRRERC